ncbi:MAG TPA: phosphoenolpyruvate--protein phosphotransferase [Candidatus Limnocylindria bacterium]|nr:phosphoenolpyruvate--protein phosphotransferase [Candidatus Limnocylindria bacterium]
MVDREASGERVYSGIPVSPGVAHAKIVIYGRRALSVPHAIIEETEFNHELTRLQKSLVATRQELQEVQRRVSAAMGASEAGLFDAHLLVLEDATLLDEVTRYIQGNRVNAEYAFHQVAEKYVQALAAVDDAYLRERAADIRDVAGRVLDNLMGRHNEIDLEGLKEPCILLAHDLPPSVTATLDRTKILAFGTDVGGPTSHTAIMARKLDIPAVVGLVNITSMVRAGEYALVDGHGGSITINPTDQTLFQYGQLKRRRAEFQDRLNALKDQPAITLDGHRLTLSANIDGPADIEAVQRSGAEGVGLFRTEFLFINRRESPNEEEQFQIYQKIAQSLAPDPVIIRTMDLGGDKLPSAMSHAGEPNPFLGWRAIRISLREPLLFRAQLRAILRASASKNVKLLYPMISGIEEVRAANAMVQQCRDELKGEGIPFDPEMEIGVMIEVPSAALIAEALAREVDFFSLGTNDLTGYTLAVDRLNERVAHLYAPTHPGVVRLIKATVDGARKHGRWVGVCGEMAGDPALVPLLVGLGVTEISATPVSIARVKFMLRRLCVSEAKQLAETALECDSGGVILDHCNQLGKRVAPELF